MKRTIYLLLTIIGLSFTACDNYLDIQPKGQIIIKTVDEYNSIFNDSWLMYYEIDQIRTISDESWTLSPQGVEDGDQFYKANFLWDESIDRVSLHETDIFYNSCYKRISRYNIIIHEVPDAEGPDDEKKEVIAKAKILRAYNHFFLVNIYAKAYDPKTADTDNGILLVKKFDMEQELTQSTVQDAYDFILEDLQAIEDLPERAENAFNPSKGFGYALLAKVYLFMHQWDKALEAANKSLSYNDFIFDYTKWVEESPQSDIPYDAQENLIFAFGINTWAPSWSAISPSALDRFDATISAGKVQSSDIRASYFYAVPYWLPGADFAYYNVPWGGPKVKFNIAGMRAPEVWLMKAECLARTGKVAEAMDIVNNIRIKRINPDDYVPLTASTNEEAVNIIIDERARELVQTLNRFWDMRRMNTEPEFARTYTKIVNRNEYSIAPGSHLYIFPFSQEATKLNPGLKQNTK